VKCNSLDGSMMTYVSIRFGAWVAGGRRMTAAVDEVVEPIGNWLRLAERCKMLERLFLDSSVIGLPYEICYAAQTIYDEVHTSVLAR
jgi:hypothetical protein